MKGREALSFLKRIFKKNQDPVNEWCITYIDINNFRRDRVMVILREAGIDVKSSKNHLLVTQSQYNEAMDVLRSHGYY